MTEEFRDSTLQLRPLPPDDLEEIGLSEFLDIDQRPIFIIDLSDSVNQIDASIKIVRSNHAFKDRGLEDTIHSCSSDFKAWITSWKPEEEKNRIPFSYSELKWTSYTLRQKWRFVCGDEAFERQTAPASPLNYPTLSRYVLSWCSRVVSEVSAGPLESVRGLMLRQKLSPWRTLSPSIELQLSGGYWFITIGCQGAVPNPFSQRTRLCLPSFNHSKCNYQA